MANADNTVAVDTGILMSELQSITGYQGDTVTEKMDAAFDSDTEKCRTFRVPIYYADGEPTIFPNGSTLWDQRHNVWELRQGCPAAAKTDSKFAEPVLVIRRYDDSPPSPASVLSGDLAPMFTLQLLTQSGGRTGGHSAQLIHMPAVKGAATTLTTSAVTVTGTPVSVEVADSTCMYEGQSVLIDYPYGWEWVTISSIPDSTHVVATFSRTHTAAVRIGNPIQGSKIGIGVSVYDAPGNTSPIFPANYNLIVVSREGHQGTCVEIDAANATGRGPGEYLADPYYPWINGQIILSNGAMEGRVSTNGTQVTWTEGLADFPTDGSMNGHMISLGGIGAFTIANFDAGAGDSSTVLHTTASTGAPQSGVPYVVYGKGISNALYITAGTGIGAATRGIFIGAARENAILIGTDLGGGGAYAPDRGVGVYAAITYGVVVGPNQAVPGGLIDIYAQRAPAAFYMATARTTSGTSDSGNIRFEAMESDIGRLWDIYVKSGNIGLCFAYAAGNKVTISPNGQLLIGATTPLASGLLRVHTGDNENLVVRKGTDLGASGGITLQSVNDVDDSIMPMVLVGNPFVLLSGNLYLGNAADDGTNRKLQVTGDVNVSGGYFCQGIEVISATQTLKNLTNTVTEEELTADRAIQIVMGDENVYKILAKIV